MLPAYFAIIGSVIASLGSLYYLYCTIRGSVKPNRITWFFWGAFPMIAFAAQLVQEVGLVAWATFVAGAPAILIFIAALFNKNAYWKIKNRDYLFALIGIIGIILWQLTNNPNYAITFAIFADLAVAMPTILKAIENPETEDWKAFALGTFGFFLAFLSIEKWTYDNFAFVGYLLFVNALIAFLASRKPTILTADAS